jgi:hypothetical protein
LNHLARAVSQGTVGRKVAVVTTVVTTSRCWAKLLLLAFLPWRWRLLLWCCNLLWVPLWVALGLILILLVLGPVVVLSRALLLRTVGSSCPQIVLHCVTQRFHRGRVIHQVFVGVMASQVPSQILVPDTFGESLQDFVSPSGLWLERETLATQSF